MGRSVWVEHRETHETELGRLPNQRQNPDGTSMIRPLSSVRLRGCSRLIPSSLTLIDHSP
jgi:hypothetical protein